MKFGKLPNPEKLMPLTRVVKTRLDSAERGLQKEIRILNTIELEVLEREGKVKELNEELLHLQSFFSDRKDYISERGNEKKSSATGGCVDALSYKRGLDRRYWLKYDLDREDYNLKFTYEELREQLSKVAQARAKYIALQSKYSFLDDSFRAARKSKQLKDIKRQEADLQGGAATFDGQKGRIS